MSRFDYVKYDEASAKKQATFKETFEKLAELTERGLPKGRAQSLVFTKLEEAYMWVGKAIRDEQVESQRSSELQENRTNS